ncbi:MAG TPA: MATE family efflux transporter [Acidimicrobiia bacterium]|nr:MATE family efflux transporter [Acidimicrobiia bacterium]
MRLGRSPHDRAIATLAIPALGSLIADPLLSLVDTAFVGRLGTDALAALGVSAAVFGVAFFVFNFLEYGTTSEVAKAVGRGDGVAAGRAVVTALGLAVVCGVAVTFGLIVAAESLVRLFGGSPAVVALGATYVGIRALAAPAVLFVRASNGALRGFQDTTTPMVVAIAINALNLALDPILIFGFGMGIAGAAWATVAAQWCAAVAFLVIFRRGMVRYGIVGVRPIASEVRRFLRVGRDLVIRTASLLATFTLATAVATRVSSLAVAAHQVMSQLFLLMALALDALAIAAQALVGLHVGAARNDEARAVADRLLVLGLGVGVMLSGVLAAVRWVLPGWFSSDPDLHAAIGSAYWILVALQPLAAAVFVWDGVFIGLGDFRFLARAMVLSALVAGGLLLLVVPLGLGLPGVWWGLVFFLAVRAVTLGWRRWGDRSPLRVHGS